MDDFLLPVEFRAAWVYRRLGIYLSAGALLFAGALVAIERIQRDFGQLPNQGPGPEYVAATVAACSVFGLVPFYWKLRVDQHGISRRRWSGWDHWSWEEFASGRFQLGNRGLTFRDTRALWFRTRRLDLGWLDQHDREQVWRWIELVWIPSPTVTPDEISLNLFGTDVRCTSRGMTVVRGRLSTDYSWDDVESLRIIRNHHRNDDFRWLILEVSDWEMRLRCHQGSQRWRGPDAETIARFLTRHVSDDRMLICATLDPPRTAQEADLRVDEAWKKMNLTRKSCTFVYVVVVGLCEWYSVTREPVVLGFMLLVLQPALLIYVEHRSAAKDYDKNVQWQQELLEQLDNSTDFVEEKDDIAASSVA